MARKREFYHTRFDGGMTHNKRDTSDLTKLALISHLDIYRDHNEMRVMPGYVSDNAYGGSSTGLKTYDIRAFADIGSLTDIYALGTKSDGTGSKIFVKNVVDDTEWETPSGGFSFWAGEGTADLIDYPFFWFNGSSDFNYPVKDGITTKVAKHGSSATSNYEPTWQTWLSSVATLRTYAVPVFTGVTYLVKGGASTGLSSISSSSVVVNAKTTASTIYAVASGSYLVGLAGDLRTPRRGSVLLWDSASLLADQNNNLGKGTPMAIGFPSNVWATVKQSAFEEFEANGREKMTVQVLQGESVETLYSIESVSGFDAAKNIFDLNDYYDNAMLWYGKAEVTSGTFVEGVWALGKGNIDSQFGVTLLFDTSSLGQIENAQVFGSSVYFAHNEDGSVSRLGNFTTGTYDVPATIETLIYGADSPYLKELDGITITTEDLPSGGSVVAYYKKDEDDPWTEMGTSNTVGKQKHSFTREQGTPIGRFQEIQFKFVITGKIVVKNIHVQVTETDDLP